MKVKIKWKQSDSETLSNVISIVASNNNLEVARHNEQNLIPLANVDFITIIYEKGDKQYKEEENN